MVTQTRKYTVPLRKETHKVPQYKRAKKAVTAVRLFLKKHMKGDTVKIGPALNNQLWSRGIKNPPHKISLEASKQDDYIILAELEGHKYPVKKTKKEKKEGGLRGKLESLTGGKKEKSETKEEKGKRDEKEGKIVKEEKEKSAENKKEPAVIGDEKKEGEKTVEQKQKEEKIEDHKSTF